MKILLFFLSSVYVSSVYSQNNPDDFWLNNGFSSGQTVYTNTGHFYDDGGYDLYHPGQTWNVTFCSENGNPITFDFNGFRTYYGGGSYTLWDYMSIIYAPSVNLVAYDFDTPQFSFTSPDGCIRFGFRSQPLGVSTPDSGWIAEISANPPPVNNDPCDAIMLSVGNVCNPSFYSNKGAWDTRGLGSPSCHEFFGGDVWFSVVVPETGNIKIETLPGSLRYAIIVLYRGTCSNLSQIACIDNPGNMPVNTFTGLNPGETVYLRIFGDQAKSGTFGICATDPDAEITGYTGPGGVGDSISNRLWLKAESGPIDNLSNPAANGANVNFWLDKSGNENHLKQSNSQAQPVYNISGLNGRPTLTFDGVQSFMTDTIGTSSSPIGIFVVNDYAISKDQVVLALGNASDLNTLSVARENISNQYYTFTNTKQYGQALPSSPQILYAEHGVATPYHTYKLNGTSQTVNYTESQVSTNGALYLGVDKDENDYLDGNLSEVIIYTKQLNEAQEIIVTNYLAAKYSLAIENDYYEFQDTHPFDLAGIGRTDASNIHSRAMSAGVLSIGGAAELDDNEFVLIAHDGADFSTWVDTEVPSGDNDIVRLAREWRVDISGGDPGTLTITLDTLNLPQVPVGFVAYNILIDPDGDFTSGAQSYGLISSGKELLVNSLELQDSCFIAVSAVRAKVRFSSISSSEIESIERPQIDVELNHAVSFPVQVNYSVISGTAEKGVDYSLNDGYLLFNPGEKIKPIIPLIFNDDLVEIPDENFTIQLSDPTDGVFLGDTISHIFTIIDDDLSLYITATDSSIGECLSSSTILTAHALGKEPLEYSWSPAEGLGNPSSAITTANPISTTTYKVTITGALGGTLSDSILITVEDSPSQPIITTSGETEFCEGGSVLLSGPDNYSYQWNNGNTSQSIDVTESGFYSLIITDENGCSSISSEEVTVVVNQNPDQPTIEITGSTEFCDGDSVALSAPDGYRYLWNTGDTERILYASTQGSYFVVISDRNFCSSIPSDTVNITVHSLPEKPVVQADGPLEFCTGGNVTLTAPSGYNYLWNDGQNTQSIIVENTDTFTVVVTDDNSCNSLPSDPVFVKANPVPVKPVIVINGDTNLCEGDSIELSAPEGYNYIWSTGESTRNIFAKEEGSYYVTVSNLLHGCTSQASDPVSISVTAIPAKPVIGYTGDLRFCENEFLELSAPAGYSYLWNTGATSQTISVNESDSYTLIVSKGGCSSPSSDAVEVIVDELPEKPLVTASSPLEFCRGESVELSAPEGFTYVWSNGETADKILVSESGNFRVALINGTCTSDSSEQVEVIVNPNPPDPTVNYSTSTELCEGESVKLYAPEGYQDYIWSNGSLDQYIDVFETGNYTVTVTDEKGCKSNPSQEVPVHVYAIPPQPTISYSGLAEFCEGDSMALLAPDGYTYSWSNGETSQEIYVQLAGNYSVKVYNGICPSVQSETVNVMVNPLPEKPVITPAGPIQLITGQSVTLSTEQAQSYLWSTGETARDIFVSSSGSYSVSITSDKACSSPVSDPVEVIVSDKYPAPEITIDGETSFCEGGSVILSTEEAFAYSWSNGETTRSITVSEKGRYTVIIKDQNGNESELSSEVEVEVYENPVAIAEVSDVRCFNGSDGSVTLTVFGGTSPYSVDWTGGYDGLSISGLQAGIYTATVIDENGCLTQISSEVEQPADLLITAEIADSYCPDANDGQILLTISGGTPEYAVNWEYGGSSSLLKNLYPGTYQANVSDQNNCMVSKNFAVNYLNEFCFKIPDIITPNNDGKNDEWVIAGLEFYPAVEVEIYDRWGKRIFYSKGYDQNFDGTLNGKDLPMESYHYIINLNNGSPVIIGNITIVR